MTTGRIDYSPDYKSEKQACETPAADQKRYALEHYDKISSAAHEWHSAIPRAIEAYYADPSEVEHLRDAVVEAAKRDRLAAQQGDGSNRDIDAVIDTRRALNDAIDRLLEFESLQEKKG